MAEQRRASRHTTRPAPRSQAGATEEPSAAQRPVSLFPIRLVDVLLYDVHVDRFPDNAHLLAQPGEPVGALNVELLAPIRIGPRMEVGVKLRAQVPSAETPALVIDCTINGVFDIPPDADDELVNAFVQTSALVLIWPYARELVQSLSIRMRITPLVLPTLDVQSFSQPQSRDGERTATRERAHSDQEVTAE